MKKDLVIFIILITACTTGKFQTIIESDDITRGRPPELIEFIDIDGTQYLHDDFIKGDIYYKSQVQIPQVPLRLNLYNDQFEYLDENLVLALANQNRIDRIVIEDDVFIHIAKNPIYRVSGFVKLWNSNLDTPT